MSISVVIPVYNEEMYLGRTLESVRNQRFKDFEIIAVCNGCSDNSFEVAEKYCGKIFNLEEKNVSKAKNFGADKAKNEFLVFLDSDVVLDEDVFEKINELLINGRYFGTVKGKGKGFRNNVYLKIKNTVNKVKPWSHGVVFCDKKSFFEVNGFNEGLLHGELKDFFDRAKGRYKRINAYAEPSDRRIKNWGILKLAKYWMFEKSKKEYGAVR